MSIPNANAIWRSLNGKHQKFSAKKDVIDGITFDSKLEASRYLELRLLERVGDISRLRIHTPWPLFCQAIGGGFIKVGYYESDADYFDSNGQQVVEDCKGMRTALYLWKKKHFEAQYGLSIIEIGRKK